MNALEEDPEQKNRWKRFSIGGAVAGGLALTLILGARHIEPARRLMPEILQMAVVDDVPLPPPKKEELAPPPPPPPKPKRETPPEQKAEPAEAPKPQAEAQPDMGEAEAGLDSTSFGSGSGGMSFRAGNTQMGDPNRVVRRSPIEAPKLSLKPPKLEPARALNPELPRYPDAARKRNVQGFVLLEADIDQRGTPTSVRVRQGLERDLDMVAIASVKRWRFSPATLAGRAVPSTKLVRIRFELN